MKRFFKKIFSRAFVISLLLLAQIAALVVVITWLRDYSAWFSMALDVLAVIIVIYIINSPVNPSYKIIWIIAIGIFPIFGGPFYLIFANKKISRRQRKKMEPLTRMIARATTGDDQLIQEIDTKNHDAARQIDYIWRYSKSPVFANTETTYYPLGDDMYPDLLDALKSAKKFIFLEYFIIEPGIVWDHILDVLKQKAADGVDVRLLYDDFGCASTLPPYYYLSLRKVGIKAYAVNRFRMILDVRMNNRDHRKLAVIDGQTGFTGGMNLADEYVNAVPRFGHWKDNGVRLVGEGVYGLTLLFLTHWDSIENKVDEFTAFAPKPLPISETPRGYVQPYGDIPFDNESVGKNIYMNMINRAHRYVHLTTPYLILDAELTGALINAAKQGVDVKIITPHIPDKKIVFEMTRGNYPELIAGGVRIYEYTPGFIHAKMALVDGTFANIGTVNLDYRSLFLHMECGVFLFETPSLKAMEDDFQSTLAKSREVTPAQLKKTGVIRRLFRSLIRILTPLV